MAIDNTRSQIQWPGPLERERHMFVYESIDLLYVDKSNRDNLGDHIGLIASCSAHANALPKENRGLLHKIELTTEPNLNQSQIAIKHQVKPGLGQCAKIVAVNEKLKVAGFDSGSVIPIKNFGPKKTFNSEVASRLTSHYGQVCSLAANSAGNKFASGATDGSVAIYQARNEEIELLSRMMCRANTFVTAMSFVESDEFLDDKFIEAYDEPKEGSESMLIYGTSCGTLNLLDTRLNLADPVKVCTFADLIPRSGIFSIMCPQSNSSRSIIVGAKGRMITFDLRKSGAILHEYICPLSNNPIGAIREIVTGEGSATRRSLAFSNSTSEIEILDMATMRPDEDWVCERISEGIVRDLVQVENRIITCGDEISIGSWRLNQVLS